MCNHYIHRSIVWAIGMVVILFMGCTGASKPSTFYLLTPLPESEAVGLEQDGVSIEVGPIVVPSYLDSTQIATAGDDYKVNTDQFNRWAEPLKDTIGRVLSENLAILLKTVNVYIYPQRRDVSADFQVEVTISRFYADKNGNAILAAYWSLIGKDGKTRMTRKRSSITKRAASREIEAIVAAKNEIFVEFSREIANEIQTLR